MAEHEFVAKPDCETGCELDVRRCSRCGLEVWPGALRKESAGETWELRSATTPEEGVPCDPEWRPPEAGWARLLPGPKFLYRYRSLSGYAREDVERILAHRQIRFSCPAWFNDPFDCKVSRALNAGNSAKEKWLRDRIRHEIRYGCHAPEGALSPEDPLDLAQQVERLFKERWPQVDEIAEGDLREIQDHADNFGVLSLSEAWDNILMWSHYADGHRGICLKLRRDYLTFSARGPEKVRYSREYPSADIFSSKPHKMYENWLMTKSSDWSYEREWRVILQPEWCTEEERQGWSPPAPGSKREVMHGWHPLPQDALAGVILGCEVSSENEKLVREWLAMGSCTVPVFRAEKKPGYFALDKVKVT